MRFLTEKKIRKRIDKFVAKYATEEEVLDIGSGSASYKDLFPNRTTLDIDSAHKPDIVADIHDLPIKDGTYNTVLCIEVFEHLKNPQKAVNELQRILKPGGLLVLTTRFIFPLHDAPNDYFRFTKYGLLELFNDWEIEVLESEANTQQSLGSVIRSIFFQAKMNKFFKAILLLFALFLEKTPSLLRGEYTDKGHKNKSETPILTTGYYLVCKKKE